eukprot:gene8252-10178_t
MALIAAGVAKTEDVAKTHSSVGASIGISNVTVIYGAGGSEPVTALKNINLQVKDGEFVSLIGPSGCGKSTLLKVVSDLMRPTGGQVSIAGASP